MSYGVEIFNDASQLLIDSNNSLLHWVFTAQYRITANTTEPVRVTWPQVIKTQLPPLVFQKLQAGGYGCGNFQYAGSAGNWTGMTINPDIVGTAQTYTYCVAVFMPPKSTQTYGLQLFDANGQLILDSGYSTMVFQFATRSYTRSGPSNQSGYNRTWTWTTNTSYSVNANSYVLISNFTGYLFDGLGDGNAPSYGYYRATATQAQYIQNYDMYGDVSDNNPKFNWPFIYAIPSHEL